MRLRPFHLLLSGVVVAASACSKDATAPSSFAAQRNAAVVTDAERSTAVVISPTDQFAGTTGTSYTVTIDPQVKNVLYFGEHVLVIPARAICSATSGYGSAVWDADCKSEKQPVTIQASVRETADGIPRIDFEPQMRFSPRETVTLLLHVPNLTPASAVGRILYCSAQTTFVCVDEAALDPTLETHRDYEKSSLFRRIKHFSGYFVES